MHSDSHSHHSLMFPPGWFSLWWNLFHSSLFSCKCSYSTCVNTFPTDGIYMKHIQPFTCWVLSKKKKSFVIYIPTGTSLHVSW